MSDLNITQSAFNAGELSPRLYSRVNLEKYASGAKVIANFYVMKEGGLNKLPISYFIGEAYNQSKPSRLKRFQFSEDQGYALEFSDHKMRVISEGGFVVKEDGGIFELDIPFDIDEVWQMKFEQSADVVYITHPSHLPQMLKRFDHDNWTIEDMAFVPKTPTPTGLTAKGSGSSQTYKYKVSAINEETGEESLTAMVEIKSDQLSQTKQITLTWNKVEGCKKYNVYRLSAGMYGWISTVVDDDGAATISMSDDNVAPDFNITPAIKRNPFDGPNKYPSVCGIHEQRMAMAATYEDYELIEMSRAGTYNNFTMSNPLQDDDAFSIRATGKQINTIYHLISLNDLLITTVNGVWKVMPGDTGFLSGKWPKIKQQNVYHCDNIEPLIIGNQALFMSDGHVRTLGYALTSDGYDGEDISILATHLFDGRQLVAWDYCSSANLIWFVFADGGAVALTFIKEQQLVAYTRYITEGWFESICSVKENGVESIYAVVLRNVNGTPKRFLERFVINQDSENKEDDYLFMDCAARADLEEAVSEVSGLDYLEGATVGVMVDGGYQGEKVVENGKISFVTPGKHIKVGLLYDALYHSLSIDYPLSNGTSSLGQYKRISGARIMVENSGSFKIAQVDDKNQFVRPAMSYQNYGEGYDFVSGTRRIDLEGGYNFAGEIEIVSDTPTPLTINAITAVVAHGG